MLSISRDCASMQKSLPDACNDPDAVDGLRRNRLDDISHMHQMLNAPATMLKP